MSETSHTEDNGAKSGMAESGAEDGSAKEPTQPGSVQPEKAPAPELGFDESGQFFIVRVHVSYGKIFTIGWLEEAQEFLRAYVMRQKIESQKTALIKPAATKGLGRFNLFRGK